MLSQAGISWMICMEESQVVFIINEWIRQLLEKETEIGDVF